MSSGKIALSIDTASAEEANQVLLGMLETIETTRIKLESPLDVGPYLGDVHVLSRGFADLSAATLESTRHSRSALFELTSVSNSVRSQAREATQELGGMGQTASEVQGVFSRGLNTEALGKQLAELGASFNDLGMTALGVAGQLASAFMTGGPVGLALGATTLAVGYTAKAWREKREAAEGASKAAKDAADAAREALEKQASEIRDIIQETDDLTVAIREGIAVEEVRERRSREFVEGELSRINERKAALEDQIAGEQRFIDSISKEAEKYRRSDIARAEERIDRWRSEYEELAAEGERFFSDMEKLDALSGRNRLRRQKEIADKARKEAADARAQALRDAQTAEVRRQEDEVNRYNDFHERMSRVRVRREEEQQVKEEAAAKRQKDFFLRHESELTRIAKEQAFQQQQDQSRALKQQTDLDAERARLQGEELARFQSQFSSSQLAMMDAVGVFTDQWGFAKNELTAGMAAAAGAVGALATSTQQAFGSITSAVGGSIHQWASYSRAAEEASQAQAISAEEARANVQAQVQEVLAGISREAGTRALFEAGMGFATAFINPAASASHFAAAGTFGAIAGGAAAGARGIGESRDLTTQERERFDGQQGRGDRGVGAGAPGERDTGVTIIVQGGGVYATASDLGRATTEALREHNRRR